MSTVESYLRLSAAYCSYLGELRWSSSQDVVELPDGRTFAFNAEIGFFLEGFASGGRLIHFGHVLHLLDLLRNPTRTFTPGLGRLRYAFEQSGRLLRNAGVFFAMLCRDVHEVPGLVRAEEVCDRLSDQSRPIRWFTATFHDTIQPAPQPPLDPAAFEAQVVSALEAYTGEDLRHWLRHGRGPVREAGEALAQRLPRTLSGALAALLDRPRLLGARPFVDQLVSALALPPRRLVRDELPVGGYADVTTRGQVEQLLPSQFALDDLDFVRRFAENELLYFRREEPHARTQRALVVLFDQGVRTWGDVRIVLAAAVLALGRQAAAGRSRFVLATTAEGGASIDPLEAGAETLGQIVEASDLSANPGLALERVLEQPGDGDRDVILLTHPRSLAEEDVAAAARRVGPRERLFAMTLDAGGRAELFAIRHGAPVGLRQFRIDFTRAAAPGPARQSDLDGPPPWQGDVERIPYPFRLGIGDKLLQFDFDHEGRWLLTASQGGVLHAWNTADNQWEVVPRPTWEGQSLCNPEAVVGIAGGVVVAGLIRGRLVAAHYDLVKRTCIVRALGEARPDSCRCVYAPEYHTFIACSRYPGGFGYALDLATGELFMAPAGRSSRAHEAWEAWKQGRVRPRRLSVSSDASAGGRVQPSPGFYLDPDSGRVVLWGVAPERLTFLPLADGQPSLRRSIGLNAQCGGHTLAMHVSQLGVPKGWGLRVFLLPEGIPLGEYSVASLEHGFALSVDGALLARQVNDLQVTVHPVDGSGPRLTTLRGGFAQHTELLLGRGAMVLAPSRKHFHVIRWEQGQLVLHCARSNPGSPVFRDPLTGALHRGEAAHQGDLPEAVASAAHRFVASARTDVHAVLDRFGQVAIFDREQRLICMFVAFRDRLAGWMPDGTRLGPESLTGGPPTAGARERIGRALWQASQAGRGES